MRGSWLDRVLVAAVPTVVLLFAVNQIVLAHTSGLTPWRGGGFGMFSTADHPNHRAVRVELRSVDGAVPLDLMSKLDASEDERAARVFANGRALPRDRELARIHDLVLGAEWTLDDDGVATFDGLVDAAAPRTTPKLRMDGEPIPVEATSIEVWKATYDRSVRRVEPERLASYDVVYVTGTGDAGE